MEKKPIIIVMTVIINYFCHSIAGIRLILFPIAAAATTAIVIQFIIEADVIRIRCCVDITKKSIKPIKTQADSRMYVDLGGSGVWFP